MVPRGRSEGGARTVDPKRRPPSGHRPHACGLAIEGPLSIETSRIGQQIVDTAFRSALEKRTVKLIN